MRIVDNGSTVTFQLMAGSATFNHDLPWKYTINGSTSSWKSFDFESGGAWQTLGSWTISSSQTVSFYLGDSGTSGLGGPTTLSAAISRATVPPAPDTPVISLVDNNSVRADTASNGTGGDAIDQYQIGYGTSSTTVQHLVTASLSTGIADITGLAAGTTYYFWARAHNSLGYSGYSGRASARTWNVPPAPSSPSATKIGQTSIDLKFVSNGTGGGTGQPANTGYELGYGTNSTTPTTIVAADGTDTISGLLPGTTYYFWARSKNSLGNSAWSTRSQATMLAGAHITDGGVVKNAIPWVKVGGVWKVAKPWAKVVGVWKETQ